MSKNKKNYNKIFGLFLLIFVCFSFITNVTKAATPTITIERVGNQQNGQTSKWAWVFKIVTTDIPNNTDVLVDIYKNSVLDTEQVKEKISNNEAAYYTDSVLDSDSTYKIIFTIENPKLVAEYSAKAGDGTQGEIVYLNPLKDSKNGNGVYTLLAPIGKLTVAPDNIGDYFNTIFLIAIGLCGALAVIMIVIGGVQYMGDESIFGKTEAKSKIMSAILGLLIALGAYALLNTINPDLLGKKGVNIKQVSAAIIDLPDAGDSSVDPNFKTGNGSYSMGSISPGVASAVAKLQQGWTISGFQVSSANNTMSIKIKSGNEVDTSNVISIAHGGNGYAEVGQGVVRDRKTPKGTWTILSMTTPGNGVPIYNRTGSNMGASYWLLSAMNSGERGIGIHGSQSGTINGATAGCIRLTNADLLALLPYVKTGIPVVVN